MIRSDPLAFGLAALAVVILVSGCDRSVRTTATPATLNGLTMGTSYSIKLSRLPPGRSIADLRARVETALNQVNEGMSTYLADSEISRFNQLDSPDDWFTISPETFAVVAEALRISELTGGTFDPTVAPLVDVWNFGPSRKAAVLPGEEAIEQAIAFVGYHQVELREDPAALRKSHKNVQLDVSAIAKGFAVDQVAEILDQWSVSGYLIEIGGEMRVKGTKGDGSTWKVGIEHPGKARREVWTILELDNASLATSGDYRNYFEFQGVRYSHTIHPQSGRPVKHNLASVSVIEPSCMRADALATALLVMGPEQGYQFAVEHDLAALFITRHPREYRQRTTPAFQHRTGSNRRAK